MRSRTIILLIVALVLAGGTTMLARVWLKAQNGPIQEASPIAVPTPAKSVLIARKAIDRGQILRPEDLAWEPWPEGGIAQNYVVLGTRTPESFSGWVARQSIASGEPLIESKIVAPGNRGFLSAVLHPGMRAVSVPVTVISGISGFVFPGDYVDLIITYSVQDRPAAGGAPGAGGPSIDHKISETVLRNIRVIAIDQKLESKPGEATVAKTATFEVSPKESEIIALSSEMGKLSLSLRSLVPGPDELEHNVSVTRVAGIATASDTHEVTDDRPVSDARTVSDAPPPIDPPTTAPNPPHSVTFTVDSDISPLLHSPDTGKGGNNGAVTILRGGQSTVTSIVQQP
jgi:pilus assembly protein CpaB